MGNYCIYLRKSRADQEAEALGKGETLARHEATLLNLARKQNLTITAIYKEIVSGETISERPEVKKLLSEVEQGVWDGVLVMEIERLARGDTKDQGIVAEVFKYSDTKIITPNKIYDPNNEFDEEYFEFGLFMSRREYKIITRRIQRGRLASVNEGKFIVSTPPYGYRRIKLKNEKGYSLEPNPAQAEVVRLIFDLYTVGENNNGRFKKLGMLRIAKKLDSLNIKPLIAEKWSVSTIKDILRNPVYIGKIRWQYYKQVKYMENGVVTKKAVRNKDYIIVKGRHKAIVDKDVFDAAQKILDARKIIPLKRNQELKNPLAQLIFCGKCGRALKRCNSGNKDNTFRLKCPNNYCDNISSNDKIIENTVLSFLDDWANGININWNKNEQTYNQKIDLDLLNKLIKSTERELINLIKQQDNIYDLLEEGLYDKEKFIERNKMMSERITATKNKLTDLRTELNNYENQRRIKEEFIPNVRRVIDVYNTLETAEEKNKLLKTVIEKILYTKDKKLKRNEIEDNTVNFTLDIYPKLPKQ